MTLVISKVFTYDDDAATYIQAVEAADAQALEPATRKAINNFVLGCKADGIWSAIKASCILAGARTLTGALVPLVGTAPTNVGPFVSGDYNRKTGLLADSTKYLDSNRSGNTDPQDNNHLSIYASSLGAGATYLIGTGSTINGSNNILVNSSNITFRSRQTSGDNSTVTAPTFTGISRSTSANFTAIVNKRIQSFTRASQASITASNLIFRASSVATSSASRLAFYSIGESLDLALLDARVTALINAFAAAIP